MERRPVTEEAIAALAKAARVELPEGRRQLMAETLDGIFQLLESLDQVALGETAPAIAYRAKWEGR